MTCTACKAPGPRETECILPEGHKGLHRGVEFHEWTQYRDPRVDPAREDVLLAEDGIRVVGDVATNEEGLVDVWWGCGDPRYYWTPLPEWREEMKSAKVIYAAPTGPDPSQPSDSPRAPAAAPGADTTPESL